MNRAVVVMRVRGPLAGLAELRPLERHAAMRKYHLLPAVRGQMLAELGRMAEAGAAFRAALECDCSEPERRFLLKRLNSVIGESRSNQSNQLGRETFEEQLHN